MITEPSSSVVPAEISETIETLTAQVEGLKRELSQAQDVWQTTLAEEKNKFDALLERKELASQEQQRQWERQSQAYEERLAELTSTFEARLMQSEQNATRSLSEIDDAWQRDKLSWTPTSQGNADEANWPAQRQALEAKAQALEEKLSRLENAYSAPLIEFHAAPSQPAPATPDEVVDSCVQALDQQISILYDLVQQNASPSPSEGGRAQS